MRRTEISCSAAAILVSGLILGPISAGEAQAQIDDHLKCYKIKDDVKLKGFVDLDSNKFGLEADCKISRAKMFCVPVTKSNVQVGFDPLPILGLPALGDRICYKVKCPGPQPPDTTEKDQFGTHNMARLKAFMLCTPAVPVGCVEPPPDLVGWWPLDDDPNGTTVEDVAGSNDGTAIGGPARLPVGVGPSDGKVVGAFRFNGVDQYISVPSALALNVGFGDFSIDLWVRCGANNSGLRHLVDKRDRTPRGYTLFANSGILGIQLGDLTGTGTAVCGAPPTTPCTNLGTHPTNVCDNEWHFVALTVDRDQSGVLYVDGVPGDPFTNVTLRPGNLDTGTEFWIGRRQPNPAGSADVYWLGDIDEVELFKRALDQPEILRIFNAGSEGKCIP